MNKINGLNNLKMELEVSGDYNKYLMIANNKIPMTTPEDIFTKITSNKDGLNHIITFQKDPITKELIIWDTPMVESA